MPRSSRNQSTQRFAIPWTLVAGFGAAALATLVIAFVNFRASETRGQAVAAMDRTTLAMRQLSQLNASLKDAETGQRGFLLTGDQAYLQPYQQARDVLQQQLEALKARTSSDSVQHRLLAQIEEISAQKLRELQETIDLRKTGDLDAAMALVRLDVGKNAMDRLRELIDDLYTRQTRELEQRRQLWVEASTTSTYYSWGGSFILLGLILASAALTVREYRVKARQSWVTSGLSGLGQQLQGDRRLEDLGQKALEYLATYLRAEVGAGYVVDCADGGLRLFGGYALPRERLQHKLLPGEGLAGQAVVSRRLLHVRDVPAQHLPVSSGTGQSSPLQLMVAPAMENGEVFAVIELGFLRPVGEAERSLLERASEMLAVAIRSGLDRSRLETLLEETRRQSEELQAQQEELRVSNEELEQQSRILQESQTQMEHQQSELEQTNAHLEEQTQQLEYQREQLLRAQGALTDKARELELASQYKSEFLANMSHELRTPLNSTLILAKLLADNRPGNLQAEQIKYAQTIHAAGSDLLALINDILDLSKIEAGQVTVTAEPVTIATALQTLMEPLRPIAREKGLELAWTVDPGVPASMHTDPMRLAQVLKNLLSNALKFTAKGSVGLQVSCAPQGMLSFAVRDTGIGIAEQQQQFIFDAFRQADGSTHRKFGGTGLGLSISRDLAGLLGGTLTVSSTPGQGSVFTLTVPVNLASAEPGQATAAAPHPQPQDMRAAVAPVASAASVPALATANVAPAAPAFVPAMSPSMALPASPATDALRKRGHSGRRILVIEDDLRFADILSELAREMDFECDMANTASDGLAMAAANQPNAIVLDINLPDFSGLGVLDQLKRNPVTRHIPVHVVSVADYSQEAMGRGAVGYALKPVKREELVHALQRLEAKFTQDLRRVLVVEDDERQRESVRHLLSRSDVDIVCAGTAAAALDHLRGSTFDCMVMDLNLPDISGYELLQRMTDQDDVSFPPVIVYTGRALSRDEEQQLRRFSKSIIIKDARSPERLLDEVTLFLHQVESELSAEHRQMLQVARSRESALEGRTVLVVEDDVRNVFALSSILEPTGIRVEIARNGREALETLEARGTAQAGIDLVLMDIMMPEMDGYTAMREIRNRPQWRRLPIIALTAKAMKDDQEKCLAAGANDYIAKPLDVEKLLSLVRVWMPK
ncbi:response regulator [Delftia acidovorans]|uniref:histidine kinase n=1 Tax=Delftia acidovorans TaxID=80866 RepID=A0A7T2S5G5_DELAC|nr:response regulator [Delftia acidovorans]QPS09234.1 response regulator [Delftia acidovorans]